jgi:hypothetical protein
VAGRSTLDDPLPTLTTSPKRTLDIGDLERAFAALAG